MIAILGKTYSSLSLDKIHVYLVSCISSVVSRIL